MLIYAEILAVFGKRENSCVIFFDEAAQIAPHGCKWGRKVDVTLPQPRHLPIGKIRDKRQRLRIVDDDRVALFEVKPRCILEYDLFVYGSLGIRPTQVLTL